MPNRISQDEFFRGESDALKKASLVYIYGFDPNYFRNESIIKNLRESRGKINIVVPGNSDLGSLVNNADVKRADKQITKGFRIYDFKDFVYLDLDRKSPINDVVFRKRLYPYGDLSKQKDLIEAISESKQYFGNEIIQHVNYSTPNLFQIVSMQYEPNYAPKWGIKFFGKNDRQKEQCLKVI